MADNLLQVPDVLQQSSCLHCWILMVLFFHRRLLVRCLLVTCRRTLPATVIMRPRRHWIWSLVWAQGIVRHWPAIQIPPILSAAHIQKHLDWFSPCLLPKATLIEWSITLCFANDLTCPTRMSCSMWPTQLRSCERSFVITWHCNVFAEEKLCYLQLLLGQ